MKLRKSDHITIILTVLLYLSIIVLNYTVYSENAVFSNDGLTMKVQMLSVNNLLLMILGLILISLATLIHMQIFKYKIGKLFSIYLIIIGLSISLAPCQCQNIIIEYSVKFLAIISNIFLLQIIGHIILIKNEKVFIVLEITQIGVVLISLLLHTLCYITVDFNVFDIINSYLVVFNIVFCAVASLFIMKIYYKKSTRYSKEQIKKLSIGIVTGTILFFIIFLMPMVAIIRVPTSETIYISETSLTLNSYSDAGQDALYLLIFSVIPIFIINLLIKREYINISYNKYLINIILLVLYVSSLNIFVFIQASLNIYSLVFFNIIIFTPMVLYYIFRLLRSSSNLNLTNEEIGLNMINVLEDERENISIYLHDQILQSLIAISHTNESTENREKISLQLSNLISEVRNHSHDLYPILVEDLGLEQSLHIFFDNLRIDYNIEFNYQYLLSYGVLPKTIALSVYRIIKELTVNSIKHSDCKNINVSVEGNDTTIILKIADDGKGFLMPDKKILCNSPHMGLLSIEKQIERLNGTMRFISNPFEGAQFHISIPLNQ